MLRSDYYQRRNALHKWRLQLINHQGKIYSHIYIYQQWRKEIYFNFSGPFSSIQFLIFAISNDDKTWRDRSRSILDSLSHATTRCKIRGAFFLYARVYSGEGLHTVFQDRFSGIVAHAAIAVIRSSTAWTGISATSAGWRGSSSAGLVDGVSAERTTCDSIRRSWAIIWRPTPGLGEGDLN